MQAPRTPSRIHMKLPAADQCWISGAAVSLRFLTSQAPRTPSKIDMKLLAAVEKHKAEAAQMAERNAALSGSVRAMQSQLAKAE